MSVRIHFERDATIWKGTSADPIHSSFASMCTVTSNRKRVSPFPLTRDIRRLFCFGGDVQRCDARRPCTACLESGKSECVYEQSPPLQRVDKKSRPTGTIQSTPPHKGGLGTGSSLSRLTSEDLSLLNQSLDPPGTSDSTSSSTNPTPSPISPWEHPAPEPETAGEFGPRTPRGGSMSEIVLFRATAPKSRGHTFAAASPFSIHPFDRLLSIPRGLQTPLLLLDPEFLRVSDGTSSELDLSLYAFFPQAVTATRCVC
jgi:hypothetical protein